MKGAPTPARAEETRRPAATSTADDVRSSGAGPTAKTGRQGSGSGSRQRTRVGRPPVYPAGAIQKSFTLDARLIRRLEERAGDNLSQTVNDLLEHALEQEDMLAAAEEMAAAYDQSIDPDVEARAMALLLAGKAKDSQQ